MAVPTGEYDLTASVDLTPLFGVLEKKTTVSVTRPGENALDEQLKKLDGDDPNARIRALYDLRYFPKEGARIVPILVKILKGDDANLRNAALYVFYAFPKERVEHIDLFVSILNGTQPTGERSTAAYLIGMSAPKDAKYEKALVDALESADDNMKSRFQSGLDNYRRRHKTVKPAGNNGS